LYLYERESKRPRFSTGGSKKISDRSKQNSPISPEEVFGLFKDTIENMTTVRIVEMPIFMPVLIEKEDEFYTARSYGYSRCKGMGRSEEDAIQNLKEGINLYNQSCANVDKKMQIEALVNNIFPKGCF
jgi:predicted RNase H-like HicB family nuclease